mmetsp:Transcript_23017/g.65229  ORF Transcript_23017/g.65229 Transcript_23017/m.65229 type:complete len:307 (+) Transcript_23017:191-1111(+)
MLTGLPHHLLQFPGMRLVGGLEERDADSGLSGTPGSADAVHVVFDRQREREIDHDFHIRDVQSARSHVGGNQQRALSGFEIGQCGRATLLILVTVNGADIESIASQGEFQAFGLLLVQRKHQDALRLARLLVLLMLLQKRSQSLFSCTVFDDLHSLLNAFVGRQGIIDLVFSVAADDGLEANVDTDWIGHVLHRDLLDCCWPRRREHGGLAVSLLALGDDVSDVFFEPHIQHTIGFIQNQVLNLAQIARTIIDEIFDATRRCHHTVHVALLQFPNLRMLRNATVQYNRPQSNHGPKLLQHILRLHG